ncbi:MAG: hypothetical protein HY069_04565 [Chlamydiia bacterium]|nr:hypothetical protein [Chlamydiia bacterium]
MKKQTDSFVLLFLLPILFLASTATAVTFHHPVRRSIAPYLSGDTFRSYCTHAYDELPFKVIPSAVRHGDTIFVSGDFFDAFCTRIHPQIRNAYILVTHNGDRAYPGQYRDLLEAPKILAWFTQNPDGTVHEKLHPLPIGLENRQWNPRNVEILQRVKMRQLSKKHLLYCNFSLTSYPVERPGVYALLAHQPFTYVQERKDYEAFIEDVASSKFVLSPRGNGLDTHRLWEALYVGAIPIVKTSSLDDLYADLPVVIVQDWAEVTEAFLEQKYAEISQRSFEGQKLYLDYWVQQLESYKR